MGTTRPDVSVLVCARNARKYIERCIKSILEQTFRDFELIIIDDMSYDNTRTIVEEFCDDRIRYFRNDKWLGLVKSRNKSLRLSTGRYLFFTDSDCVVSKDWISQGLACLAKKECMGVEGKIYYVSMKYKSTFSDHIYTNEQGKLFMTGNMAYKREAIERVGGFDERYNYHEDRDLALRILKFGEIAFNPNMVVYVQQENLTPKDIINRASILKNRVYLFKRFGEKEFIVWRIVDPVNLVRILFPPIVFASLFSQKFRTNQDYSLLPFIYAKAVLERLQLWKTCATERIFLI